MSIVQTEQDLAMSSAKFPELLCRPVAAQFRADSLIALFAFESSDSGVAVLAEKHYRLVPPAELTAAELKTYRERPLSE